MPQHSPCIEDLRARQLIRLGRVLPLFAPAELSGLADFLERRVATRLARLARMRGSRPPRRLRTRLPIRIDG